MLTCEEQHQADVLRTAKAPVRSGDQPSLPGMTHKQERLPSCALLDESRKPTLVLPTLATERHAMQATALHMRRTCRVWTDGSLGLTTSCFYRHEHAGKINAENMGTVGRLDSHILRS